MRSLFTTLLVAGLAIAVSAEAGIGTLTADTYVTTASPSSNFGGAAVLNVGNGASALVQFDLSNAMSQLVTGLGATSAVPTIGRATLTVYANRVPASGNLSVATNTASWSESTVTQGTAPFTNPVFTSVAVSSPGFITLDITGIVQGWLNGLPNDGLTLSCDTCVLVLDSKEATTTSHVAALDIDLAAGFTGLLKKNLTLGAPGFTSLVSILLTGTNTAGGRVYYNVRATDGGSQIATETGIIQFTATANSITCTVDTTDKLHLGVVNSGCTPGFFNPGSHPGISIFDNVSFSSPAPIVVHEVYFRIDPLMAPGITIRLEP